MIDYPKIGIRPIIDGRWGGVRESLEAKTMAMANAAAKLISENLHYADSDTCPVRDFQYHYRRRCRSSRLR
jgi:L-fucose isomerase